MKDLSEAEAPSGVQAMAERNVGPRAIMDQG